MVNIEAVYINSRFTIVWEKYEFQGDFRCYVVFPAVYLYILIFKVIKDMLKENIKHKVWYIFKGHVLDFSRDIEVFENLQSFNFEKTKGEILLYLRENLNVTIIS